MIDFRYVQDGREEENILRVVVCCRFLPISDRIEFVRAITPTEKKNETNILKKIKITKIFGDVNAPLRALYYLTITTFYGCNG
jgi:hypothetical protein